jgi:DNA-binding transcriptional LysR family regulator
MRINFYFTDLEAFLAVRETGSFHLASERMGLSQSSITRRIQKLETALGSILFERTTRDVRPTLAAKRLQMRAEVILNDARETALSMRDESIAHAHQRALTVTVATIPTVITGLIAPAIRQFEAAGHTARIRVLDRAANEVAEAVAQAEADFGICSVPMLEPSTEFTLLFNDPIVIAMEPGHPFAARAGVDWADLADEPLILPARGTGNRLLIDEAMAKTGRPVRWMFEVSRTSTALDLVAGGIGIAPVPKSAIQSGHPHGTVVAKPVSAPLVSRPIGLIKRIGQKESAASEALMAAIFGIPHMM